MYGGGHQPPRPIPPVCLGQVIVLPYSQVQDPAYPTGTARVRSHNISISYRLTL